MSVDRWQGQALTEFLLLGTLILLLLSSSIPTLNKALIGSQRHIDEAREKIWQFQTDGKNISHDDQYSLAKSTAGIVQPLTKLTELRLPLVNRRQVSLAETDSGRGQRDEDKPAMVFTRITDDWAARSSLALVTEPASLVPLGLLNDLGIKEVQQLASWLPNLQEFSPEKLIFGYVDADVVPTEALCPRDKKC